MGCGGSKSVDIQAAATAAATTKPASVNGAQMAQNAAAQKVTEELPKSVPEKIVKIDETAQETGERTATPEPVQTAQTVEPPQPVVEAHGSSPQESHNLPSTKPLTKQTSLESPEIDNFKPLTDVPHEPLHDVTSESQNEFVSEGSQNLTPKPTKDLFPNIKPALQAEKLLVSEPNQQLTLESSHELTAETSKELIEEPLENGTSETPTQFAEPLVKCFPEPPKQFTPEHSPKIPQLLEDHDSEPKTTLNLEAPIENSIETPIEISPDSSVVSWPETPKQSVSDFLMDSGPIPAKTPLTDTPKEPISENAIENIPNLPKPFSSEPCVTEIEETILTNEPKSEVKPAEPEVTQETVPEVVEAPAATPEPPVEQKQAEPEQTEAAPEQTEEPSAPAEAAAEPEQAPAEESSPAAEAQAEEQAPAEAETTE